MLFWKRKNHFWTNPGDNNQNINILNSISFNSFFPLSWHFCSTEFSPESEKITMVNNEHFVFLEQATQCYKRLLQHVLRKHPDVSQLKQYIPVHLNKKFIFIWKLEIKMEFRIPIKNQETVSTNESLILLFARGIHTLPRTLRIKTNKMLDTIAYFLISVLWANKKKDALYLFG